MIRDEFKNADIKEIKKKANPKILKMGERAYYIKKMNDINNCFVPVKFSTILTTVSFGFLALLYIITLIFGDGYQLSVWNWAVVIVSGILIIWTFVWFVFLVPYLKNRAEWYKEQLHNLNRNYILKNVNKQ